MLKLLKLLQAVLIVTILLNTCCIVEIDGFIVDKETNIDIYFDSSGSMNSTLPPLNEMINSGGKLYNSLINVYGDDSTYKSKVRIISDPSERTLDFLNYKGASDTPKKSVIIIFQDEAAPVYHPYSDSPTSAFLEDINALKINLAGRSTGFYKGIIFQIKGNPSFKKFLEDIENGNEPFDISENNIKDITLRERVQIRIVYDVDAGMNSSYYYSLIKTTLSDMGIYLK